MADTPPQVLGRLIEHFAGGRFDQAAELYSDDCVLMLPLAPNGPALVGGAAVRALVKAGGPVLAVRELTIRTTEDPEVAIAEWDYVGRNPGSGVEAVTGNLVIARVRDGKITSERAYLDHVTRAFLTGELDTLLEALHG